GRLIRRGFAVPAVVMGAIGSTARASALPAALVDSTIKTAMAFALGQMAASVPPAIVSLSRGVSTSMLITRLTMISVTALALGVGATGVAVLAQRGTDRQGATGSEITAPSVPRSPAGTPATESPGDPLPSGALLRLGALRFRPPSIVAEMALSP